MELLRLHTKGRSSKDLRADLWLPLSVVKGHLAVLRDAGRVFRCGAGTAAVWAAIEHRKHAEVEYSKERAAKYAASKATSLARRAEKQRKVRQEIRRMRGLPERPSRSVDWEPVQITVSAKDATPLRKLGPSSVFDIAAKDKT